MVRLVFQFPLRGLLGFVTGASVLTAALTGCFGQALQAISLLMTAVTLPVAILVLMIVLADEA